jgi:DUF4097 and DUF4098 domain-containing protein YvlB
VKLSGVEGAAKLEVQKGDVRIENHRGRVSLDTYGAKVNLQNIEGDVALMNFSGDSLLTQARGNLDLRAVSGSTTLSKSSGALDFSTVRAPLTVNDFEGGVHGTTEDGAVSLQLLGDVEVGVQSNQGAVTVKLPPAAGVSLKLKTEEGVISAPEAIQIAKQGDERSANGRLNGSGPKGSVVISSKSGTIRVR